MLHKPHNKLFVSACVLALTACGGSGQTSSDSNASKSVFPTEIAVFSPLETIAESQLNLPDNNTLASEKQTQASEITTTEEAPERQVDAPILAQLTSVYKQKTGQIRRSINSESLLNAESIIDISKLFLSDHDASCFDDGMVSSTDGNSNEACSAAQFNARLSGSSRRSQTTLLLTSLLASSYNLTAMQDEQTIDLTAQLNDLELANIDFDSATVTYDADSEQWLYTLAITISHQNNLLDADIILAHQHTEAGYQGNLSYVIDDSDNDDQCQDDFISRNGSLSYSKEQDEISITSTEANACGAQNSILEQVTNTSLFQQLLPKDGNWEFDLNSFQAIFNSESLQGSYRQQWQKNFSDTLSNSLHLLFDGQGGADSYFAHSLPAAEQDPLDTNLSDLVGLLCGALEADSLMLTEVAEYQSLSFNQLNNLYTAIYSRINDNQQDSCEQLASLNSILSQ